MGNVIEFRVLGPLELEINGRLAPIRGAKQCAILAALLLANRHRESIGRLVEAVWSGRPPQTAAKQVRNAVSDLRGALAGSRVTIIPMADGYQLDPAGGVLDLHSFRALVADARAHARSGRLPDAVHAYRQALALWGGDALSGLDSLLLRSSAVGLDEERLTVTEDWVDLELRQGNGRALIGQLAQLVTDNPLRERLAAQLIMVLHQAGARDRAFATYERTRRALVTALGVDPGRELQDLRRQMLVAETNHTPAITVVGRPRLATGNLPAEPSPFLGRRQELSEIQQLAQDGGNARTVVIDGMPGIGKTALAVRAAHLLADQFPDGQFFLDLRGISSERPLTTRDALGQLLRMTGLRAAELPESLDDLVALWRDWLAGRRTLVILDNAASSYRVRPLLTDLPNCLTIVTSRRRLTMLSLARVCSLGQLAPKESAEIFQLVSDGRVQPVDSGSLNLVLDYCGHLPLAVVIAATRFRHRPSWSLAHLAGRLADDGTRLAELCTEDDEVAERLGASYRQLGAEHQRLLLQLCQATQGPFQVAPAARHDALPVHEIEHLLEGLVNEHLLEQPGPDTYRIHSLVRAFCHARPSRLGVVAPHSKYRVLPISEIGKRIDSPIVMIPAG